MRRSLLAFLIALAIVAPARAWTWPADGPVLGDDTGQLSVAGWANRWAGRAYRARSLMATRCFPTRGLPR